MNFISLFAGIGGLDLGLERAGMTCVAQVEIDDYCRAVLNKHWPAVPKFGDIHDVGQHNLPRADLICGGFPCQPFSVSGKQEGTQDDRHLWPEMLRVIGEVKPAWVVGENVTGIIPIFIDQAIADLEAKGYTCEQFVLPAVGFDAPHRRDRIFVVAYDNSVVRRAGRQSQSLEQPRYRESVQGNDAPTANAECLGQPEGTGERVRSLFPETEGQSVDNVRQAFPRKRNVANANTQRLQRSEKKRNIGGKWQENIELARGCDWGSRALWEPEPRVGRVADGVPNRVDRIKSLGNAVVPQVAEHIGRAVMEIWLSE